MPAAKSSLKRAAKPPAKRIVRRSVPRSSTRPIAGRHHERALFDLYLKSRKAEFVAVYGRRRIGKTFLIREHFAEFMCFAFTGIHDASRPLQLKNFAQELAHWGQIAEPQASPETWLEAFTQLRQYLTLLGTSRQRVIFIDELPWLASKKSGFMEALEHFWNTWAAQQPNLIVVVCGSAASWMIKHLIHNRGGLHNRVTQRVRLEPFTLAETREFLTNNRIQLSDKQIVELYMAMGGVPHYLDQVRPGLSAAQNIDAICFSKDGLLRDEFEQLFASLYEHHERHIAIVRSLAARPLGLSRWDMLAAAELPTGGSATVVLDELLEAGFITKLEPWGKKKRDTLYRLTDEYSLFYLQWIEGRRTLGDGTWLKLQSNPGWRAWSGYAFETVCFRHTKQLKRALGIAGVETFTASWVYRATDKHDQGAQIDMLIDRKDQVINICEMKFAEDEFVIDKKYAAELRNKLATFRRITQTRKSLMLTLVSTFGLRENEYRHELVANDIKMEALFL